MARSVDALAAIPLETRYFEDLGGDSFESMIERVCVAQQQARELLGGRTVWVVNSTAFGRWGFTAPSYVAALLERRGDRRAVDGAARFC